MEHGAKVVYTAHGAPFADGVFRKAPGILLFLLIQRFVALRSVHVSIRTINLFL